MEVLFAVSKRGKVFDLDGNMVIPDKVMPGRSWGKIEPKKRYENYLVFASSM